MSKFGLVRLLLSAALGPLLTTPNLAASSKDYAVMAQSTWSAFQCSSLAAKSDNSKEQERLFLFGYEQGQEFIAAVKAEKVTREDLSNDAPLLLLLLLQGPTPDFMLGRIFESAQDIALEGIYRTGGNLNSVDDQKSLAKSKFWSLNCQLIGEKK